MQDEKERERSTAVEFGRRPKFRHHSLDVYNESRTLATDVRSVWEGLPPGYGNLRDQLRRASVSVPLLVAEGAYRRSRKQKRQRFEEALGEIGECAAAIEIAVEQGVCDAAVGIQLLERASRIAAMLTGLERKFR